MSEILKVNHLKKYFHEVKAVDDISFSVERGEMFGFLGVNGAGKSTTISMLCTLLKPTGGEAEVAGCVLGKEDEEIKRRIGVVYQWNVLDDLLTVKENLICRGSLYEKDKRKLKKRMEYVCEILALSDVVRRPYGKLSGGQKRRCEIGAALLHTPEILFLDEPTTGLDPATRKSVWQTIGRLQKEMKMTVFLTTHYMEEAAKANHIGIIEKGKMVQYGTPFALKEEFAKDRLIIRYQPKKRDSIEGLLKDTGFLYKIKDEKIIATIPKTVASIPLLERIEHDIEGFEVIQGSMDDVFLNVTGIKGEKI
ncbi:MAG: ABC transporter ATP-binding protein [Lachnospiraceae bacterium]|nr:ABC transporter ATP-binding protein [Lachnospiraceae bacterium]MDE6980140.1 ABC transporter ATP-binding protein [Lachnospiraceae bacterium]